MKSYVIYHREKVNGHDFDEERRVIVMRFCFSFESFLDKKEI